MVNATFTQIFTPCVKWHPKVAFTIFAPDLLLVFAFLRHNYNKQISANPFFLHPVIWTQFCDVSFVRQKVTKWHLLSMVVEPCKIAFVNYKNRYIQLFSK